MFKLKVFRENKYILLMCTISIASFMVNLDTYVINVSLPTIASTFATDTTAISWVALSYNLMVVSLLLIFGKLGDKFGLKRLFIIGFVIFTGSSFLCGISNSLAMLVASRLIQGIGASMLYALPQAMITKYISKENRGMAFGILASAAALGITLGSPVSGLVTGYLSWRWIFFINVPVGIFAVYFLLKALPKDFLDFSSKTPFDFIGAISSFLFALSLTFYLNQGNNFGWISFSSLGMLFISVIFFSMFVVRIKNYKFPLLDIKLFKNLNFDYANIAMLGLSMILAGTNFLMPFYLTEVKGFSPSEVGFILMFYSISYMIASVISGKLSNKFDLRFLCTVSMGLYLLNVVFFVVTLNSNSLVNAVLFLIFSGISFAFFITSNNNLVMSMASKKDAGMIAGIHRMIGRFGMLLGIAAFEAVFAINSSVNVLEAFKDAYILGAIACIVVLIFSVLKKENVF